MDDALRSRLRVLAERMRAVGERRADDKIAIRVFVQETASFPWEKYADDVTHAEALLAEQVHNEMERLTARDGLPPTSGLVWRKCVCGAWYWGSEQTEADAAHSVFWRDADAARAAPQADAGTLREAAEAVMDVADYWTDETETQPLWDDIPVELADKLVLLRAALATSSPATAGLDVERLRLAIIKSETAHPDGGTSWYAEEVAAEYERLAETP